MLSDEKYVVWDLQKSTLWGRQASTSFGLFWLMNKKHKNFLTRDLHKFQLNLAVYCAIEFVDRFMWQFI